MEFLLQLRQQEQEVLAGGLAPMIRELEVS